MRARKPYSSNAQGACSREEPQPKLRPVTRIVAPGLIQLELWIRLAVGQVAPVEEGELTEPGALDALEELFGDDLVGVHVDPRQRRHDAGELGERFHAISH